ncbi:MAG: hypothetical protein ACC641_08685, partial [Acidiferrobacterales bacterium]
PGLSRFEVTSHGSPDSAEVTSHGSPDSADEQPAGDFCCGSSAALVSANRTRWKNPFLTHIIFGQVIVSLIRLDCRSTIRASDRNSSMGSVVRCDTRSWFDKMDNCLTQISGVRKMNLL